MFIKNKDLRLQHSDKHVSLRRYWTSRYLLTLFTGLIVIAIISALWIRHTTLENRLGLMSLLAENMADRIVKTNDQTIGPPDLFHDRKMKTELEIDPFTYTVDIDGNIISSNRPSGPIEQQLNPSILESEDTFQQLSILNQEFYVVKSPIEIENSIIGWVVMVESKNVLTHVKQEYTQLAIMIISLAILGWAAIYVLSNRLAKPIKDVADAAKLVAEGNYQIEISNQSKEKEVYELIHSFKEMGNKLERLESLRTELLAGVTHELKTPVTSISGLLQALRDGVVTGDEASEFLNISINETEKMKTMVEDLLAFNQFATHDVPVRNELHDINDVVENAIYSWEVSQIEKELDIQIVTLSHSVNMAIDHIRFQQVMTNLLNNTKHARGDKGEVRITMSENETEVNIDVADNGNGIPETEQPFIFERFFRGEEKKYKVRGLGLGLALSKMITQALGGDLILLKSTSEGTTFRIILSKNNS